MAELIRRQKPDEIEFLEEGMMVAEEGAEIGYKEKEQTSVVNISVLDTGQVHRFKQEKALAASPQIKSFHKY